MSEPSRFFVPAIPSDGLVRLEGAEARHALQVLRLTAGDAFRVFDGTSREALCRITEAARDRIEARVEREREVCAEPAVRLCFYPSLSKGDRFSWTLQKLCELGASDITPVLSERCVARDWTEQKSIRYRRILLESSKQCGRGRLPVLHDPVPLESLLGRPMDGVALFCHETAEQTLSRTLQEFGAFETAHVFTGPEGGYSPAEFELAVEHGVRPVRMGGIILRCETAPLAAAAALLFASGQF